MDFIDYREKLGMGFNDKEKERLFFNRIYSFLDDVNRNVLTIFRPKNYADFCIDVGIYYESVCDELDAAIECIKDTKTLNDFLSYYMFLVKNIPEDNDEDENNVGKSVYINILKNMLDLSHIPFDIIEDDDGVFIFPKGAKELDDALVSQPLEWLKDYPNARKTYVTALKQYTDGEYIRDTADNLRKALETFLQEFLNNSKNLETNKNEICKYLGLQGVDTGISGLFQPLINSYKNINDRIVKHNDAVDEKLLEFLLYQTGVLIRMILSVKKAELKN